MADLANGREAEVRVQKYMLKSRPDCYYAQSQGKNSDYDLYCILHMGERVEVKHDRKAVVTGNLCFEKKLFATTRSPLIVYVIGDRGHIFEKDSLWSALKELAAQGRTTFRMLGDRDANPAVLVKKELILPLAEEIELEG